MYQFIFTLLFIFIGLMVKFLHNQRKHTTQEFEGACMLLTMDLHADVTFFPTNARYRINELASEYRGRVFRKSYNRNMQGLWTTYKVRKTFSDAKESGDSIFKKTV